MGNFQWTGSKLPGWNIVESINMWATKKNYFPLNPGWLIGILISWFIIIPIYLGRISSPTKNPTNQGPFFHGSCEHIMLGFACTRWLLQKFPQKILGTQMVAGNFIMMNPMVFDPDPKITEKNQTNPRLYDQSKQCTKGKWMEMNPPPK